jgi:hypothetical protein
MQSLSIASIHVWWTFPIGQSVIKRKNVQKIAWINSSRFDKLNDYFSLFFFINCNLNYLKFNFSGWPKAINAFPGTSVAEHGSPGSAGCSDCGSQCLRNMMNNLANIVFPQFLLPFFFHPP